MQFLNSMIALLGRESMLLAKENATRSSIKQEEKLKTLGGL